MSRNRTKCSTLAFSDNNESAAGIYDGHSFGQLALSLLLAIVHLLAGFSILMVSSWFIAACSIAGLGFNYLLPAVVIRALAILRIASGYFAMLAGHSHLLKKLAALRLTLFASLQNTVSVSREESLDVLHHQSEEVASIWMAWVGQNAGAVLSLLLLNVLCATMLPELSPIMWTFTAAFIVIYTILLAAMAYKSAELVTAKKKLQFQIIKHVEAAPLWHLYADYDKQAPLTHALQQHVHALQQQIRTAALLLFTSAMIGVYTIFSVYSHELAGNALSIIVPIALLSVNDWLSPTLGSQKQLLSYLTAKRALASAGEMTESVDVIGGDIEEIELSDFKAANTKMPSIEARFVQNSTTVVMGSSGIGKSRFLQALSGLLRFDGQRRVVLSAKDGGQISVSQGLLANSFYLEQFPYVLSDTLAENLRVANRDASDSMLLATLKQVGLDHLNDLGQWLGEHGLPLSGGEKKRLGLARAMLSRSQVLLLDEPFESLDKKNIERIAGIINTLASHRLVILATHMLPANLQYQQLLALEQLNRHDSKTLDYGVRHDE
jgi:ATP-binding cassette subfamily C protein CydC